MYRINCVVCERQQLHAHNPLVPHNYESDLKKQQQKTPWSCQELTLLHSMLMLAGNPWYAMWTLVSCLIPLLTLSLLREQYLSTATTVKREGIGV